MISTLVFIILLLLANAFFVGAEFGLIAARRTAIEVAARSGSRSAHATLKAMEQVSLMLAGAQLGVTLCSLGLGALGEPFIARLLHDPFMSLGITESLLHPISLLIALAVMTYLHVVIGEMVPKNIALAKPERAALLLVPPLAGSVRLLYPAVIGLNNVANACSRALGIKPKAEVASTFTRDEVAGFVEESHREGLLSEDEEHLLSGSLQFDEQRVRSVLLPRERLTTVTASATPNEIETLVAQTGFSRFPVENAQHELIGYVHLKDILDIPAEKSDQPLPKAEIRSLVSLRATSSLRNALTTMRRAGSHMAQVRDSRGHDIGIVMLEDVLEELVGEIRDETSTVQPATRQ